MQSKGRVRHREMRVLMFRNGSKTSVPLLISGSSVCSATKIRPLRHPRDDADGCDRPVIEKSVEVKAFG